jgi:hypothetical protein
MIKVLKWTSEEEGTLVYRLDDPDEAKVFFQHLVQRGAPDDTFEFSEGFD